MYRDGSCLICTCILGAVLYGASLGFFMPGNERPIDIGIEGERSEEVVHPHDLPHLVVEVNWQKAAAVGLKPKEVILQVVAASYSSIDIERKIWVDVRRGLMGSRYYIGPFRSPPSGCKVGDFLNIEATGTNKPWPVKPSSLVSIRHCSPKDD